jgi:hypothetical protein
LLRCQPSQVFSNIYKKKDVHMIAFLKKQENFETWVINLNKFNKFGLFNNMIIKKKSTTIKKNVMANRKNNLLSIL